ncbi:hypothetical protein [Sphingomonas koreensis]
MSAARIIERMFGLLRDNAVPVAITILALAALGTAWDYYNPNSWLSLPLNIASAIAQYWIIRQALAREGLLAANLAGAPASYIGVSIVSGLGIMLGFVLLIIPGILLSLRWMPAVPLVLGAERLHANDALGEAWNQTSGHWQAIGAAYLLTLLPFAGAMFAYAWETVEIPEQLAALGTANLLLNLWMISSWMLSIAVYQGFASREREFEDIFA